MMNKQEIEKVLDGLKRTRIAMFNYCIDGERVELFLNTAISALEKQMPKKPEYDCHKHLYICPHCGEYIVTYNQEFPYDMKCGGRLEW